MLKQSNGLEFFYDARGIAALKYNNAMYFYRKDAQGNVIAILDGSGKVVVKYEYDAWGNHNVSGSNTTLSNLNPFRYRSYFYDTETKLYYLQTRYYDPEVGRFISQDSIEYADPESIHGLNLYAYCVNNPVMNIDPTGTWSWSIFWKGLGLLITAVAAIALSVSTFGAGTPLAMTIVAGVTLAAGVLTGINGLATVIEAGTNYNFVRDGVFQGNEIAYNWYSGIAEGVAAVGTLILGIYNSTGRAKAAREGQNFLGKGYKRVDKGRWVSADGFRQMRLDNHKPFGTHFNFETFKNNYWLGGRNKILDNIHQLYKWFRTWIG